MNKGVADVLSHVTRHIQEQVIDVIIQLETQASVNNVYHVNVQ